MNTDRLREDLAAHLDSITPPAPDLATVTRRGRRTRLRRTTGVAMAAAASITVVGLGAGLLDGDRNAPGHEPEDFASGGTADLGSGLRAFAEPYERLYLAGTSLPIDDAKMPNLDTDAVATPYGIVYYDEGAVPTLLEPDGRRTPLLDEAESTEDWHPTAKADSVRPLVTFARLDDPKVVLSVYDVEKNRLVARTDLPCEEDCSDLTIEAIDSGMVFVRVPSGVRMWSYRTDEWADFAGPDTRIADVRNRVVLYEGAAPDLSLSAWKSVPTAIDSQLSFDGAYVLGWSPVLEPTTPGDPSIELDLPVPATFFTFDTDGSVLAATAGDPSQVFDCPLPTGACEPVGRMSPEHGDPMFLGNDM